MSAAVTRPQLSLRGRACRGAAPRGVADAALRARADAGGAAIRAVMLDVQLQIAAVRRSYDPAEQEALARPLRRARRWAEMLRTVPWLRATIVVPPFDGHDDRRSRRALQATTSAARRGALPDAAARRQRAARQTGVVRRRGDRRGPGLRSQRCNVGLHPP